MKLTRIAVIMAAALCATGAAQAEETQPNDIISRTASYNTLDQWSLQAQGGINFLCAENTGNNSGKQAAGSYAISIAKQFTPLWGARLQMLGGGDKSFTKTHESYSFHHLGVFAEAQFNLTNVCRQPRAFEPVNVRIFAGPGIVHSAGFDIVHKEFPAHEVADGNSATVFSFIGGAEAAYSFNQHLDISLEVSTNWMQDKYNGVVYGRKIDGTFNILAGIRYTF